MPPAARVNDNHTCNMPGPSMPHVGGPILAPGSATVLTDNEAQARATDQLLCVGGPAPDFITTGSKSVDIDGLMAARQTDKTMHAPPGNITTGSPDVEIGGPTGGATLGRSPSATAACNLAAGGRNPPPGAVYPPGHRLAGQPVQGNTTKQSYNNCGVESARQIINQVSPPGLSQEQLLAWATSTNQSGFWNWLWGNKLAVNDPSSLYKSGGTWPWTQREILAGNGVPAHREDGTLDDVAQAAAEGKGVIANIDAAFIWSGTPTGAWHAILITGVQYDQNGNPIAVIINDTGNNPPNNCGVSYPAWVMLLAMRAHGGGLVVTDNPVW